MNIWPERINGVRVIYDTEVGKIYKCSSGKCAWEKIGHAKNAFKLCTGTNFDKQGRFELKELVPV